MYQISRAFFSPDDARQEPGAVARVHTAHAGPGLTEDRGLRRERQVAKHVEHVTTSDREAVDHRDDGLGDVPDRAVQRLHVHRPLIGRVASLPALLLVAAGAEGLVARACEHDDTDGPVPASVHERISQLGDRACAERVAHLRTVNDDPGHAILLLVADVGIVHDWSPPVASGLGQAVGSW